MKMSAYICSKPRPRGAFSHITTRGRVAELFGMDWNRTYEWMLLSGTVMSFKPINFDQHLYFVTAAISGWVKLLERRAYKNIIVDALKWHCEKKRWTLFAFVIMPNHMHKIIKPTEPFSISDNLQSFLSFTFHAILKQLRADSETTLLEYFKSLQTNPSKTHKIWKDSQAKNIYDPDFLIQKLEYVHNNPIAKHWNLADGRAKYMWSSACFYDLGREPVVPVSDVRGLL